MRRTPILLLGLLLLAAPAAAEEFRDAKIAFEAVFPGGTAEERLQAVCAVGFYDTKDAAKLLLSAVEMTQDRIDPMATRLSEASDRLRDLLGDQMLEGQRTYPEKISDEIRHLKAEAAAIKEKIDAENRIFTAVEDALGRMREPDTVEWIGRSGLPKEKHWKSRQVAALALTEIGTPEAGEWLAKGLRDKDDRVKLTAAIGVGKLRVKGALEDLLALLGDKTWTIRSACIQALGEVGEKGAVGPLIDQMEKETGRLQEDCAEALARLTGQRIGAVPSAWRKWWEEHKDEYGTPEGPGPGAPPPGRSDDPGYYGIPITTNRAIFILDVSGSMSKSTEDANRDPGAGESSKIERAKAELIRVLGGFDPKGAFNVIIFNDAVKRWKDAMVPATKENKAAVKDFVAGLSAASSTNIYDALELAFRTAGMGATDKHYDLAADTIFLLSDGSPTNPDGSLDDWMKIIRACREWNRLKRVKIHAIGVGGHNAAFMRMLASENGGEYVSR